VSENYKAKSIDRQIGTIFGTHQQSYFSMKTILFFFSLSFFKIAIGQDSIPTNPYSQTAVIVHKDPRVDILVKKQASINEAIKKASARTAKGYRLLIVNTHNREEAIAAKTKIYTYFPELSAYMTYQSPYFKLKAGNFKTRDEAERVRKSMVTIFPKGVFIINDIVEVKPEKEID